MGADLRVVRYEGDGRADISEEMTLRQWHLDEHRPELLAHAAAATRRQYLDALAWWEKLAGDPPLFAIGPPRLRQFVADLQACLAPGTVRKHCGNLSRILEHAGRPRIEPPPPPEPEIGVHWTPAELRQVLAACELMGTPRLLPGQAPAPAAWWRALIAGAYFHAFRVGTLLRLEWRHLTPDGQWRIPAELVKGRRGRRRPIARPCHPEALELLEAIREPGRDRIWPWYPGAHSDRFFRRQWRLLTRRAGLAEHRRAGTHTLRRTHATALAEASPEHARLSLGHSRLATTADHYIAGAVAARAALALTLRGPDEPAPADG